MQGKWPFFLLIFVKFFIFILQGFWDSGADLLWIFKTKYFYSEGPYAWGARPLSLAVGGYNSRFYKSIIS